MALLHPACILGAWTSTSKLIITDHDCEQERKFILSQQLNGVLTPCYSLEKCHPNANTEFIFNIGFMTSLTKQAKDEKGEACDPQVTFHDPMTANLNSTHTPGEFPPFRAYLLYLYRFEWHKFDGRALFLDKTWFFDRGVTIFGFLDILKHMQWICKSM